jgi:hypothetical protein
MKMEMKKFREVKTCPKCTAGRLSGEIDCFSVKHKPMELVNCKIIEEHMEVTCSCGYVFKELCADNLNSSENSIEQI